MRGPTTPHRCRRKGLTKIHVREDDGAHVRADFDAARVALPSFVAHRDRKLGVAAGDTRGGMGLVVGAVVR